MILEKIRSCLGKLKLGLQTCGLIRLLGLSGPNLISRPQTAKSRHFLRFHNCIGFISFPSGPNVVSRPQNPRLRHFLKFHNLIGFVI